MDFHAGGKVPVRGSNQLPAIATSSGNQSLTLPSNCLHLATTEVVSTRKFPTSCGEGSYRNSSDIFMSPADGLFSTAVRKMTDKNFRF